ncbi:uncharacterized protein LOC119681997 [Teleopsis dalmanni]|uniref:uncharacterized protein LOC119681997 n=1 Tax=Teleopsis dalmanni TaxID=139649 RepID=UPI0018CD4A51|nr:uncharacterized protein LOC119681997 [Teleopsis dalmanni]
MENFYKYEIPESNLLQDLIEATFSLPYEGLEIDIGTCCYLWHVRDHAVARSNNKASMKKSTNMHIHSFGSSELNEAYANSSVIKRSCKKDDTVSEYPKPHIPYSILTALAFKNSKNRALKVVDIYEFINSNFPYFRSAPQIWKKNIRHNVSMHKWFKKCVSGKNEATGLWAMNLDYEIEFTKVIKVCFAKHELNIRNAMMNPENFEKIMNGEMKGNNVDADAELMDNCKQSSKGYSETVNIVAVNNDIIENNKNCNVLSIAEANTILTNATSTSVIKLASDISCLTFANSIIHIYDTSTLIDSIRDHISSPLPNGNTQYVNEVTVCNAEEGSIDSIRNVSSPLPDDNTILMNGNEVTEYNVAERSLDSIRDYVTSLLLKNNTVLMNGNTQYVNEVTVCNAEEESLDDISNVSSQLSDDNTLLMNGNSQYVNEVTVCNAVEISLDAISNVSSLLPDGNTLLMNGNNQYVNEATVCNAAERSFDSIRDSITSLLLNGNTLLMNGNSQYGNEVTVCNAEAESLDDISNVSSQLPDDNTLLMNGNSQYVNEVTVCNTAERSFDSIRDYVTTLLLNGNTLLMNGNSQYGNEVTVCNAAEISLDAISNVSSPLPDGNKLLMNGNSQYVNEVTIRNTVQTATGFTSKDVQNLNLGAHTSNTVHSSQTITNINTNTIHISAASNDITEVTEPSVSRKQSPQKNKTTVMDITNYPKPPLKYPCLIAIALKNSTRRALSLSEIYNFICEHFPYFRFAHKQWKSSLRYSLSINKCFKHFEKSATNGTQRKERIWYINPKCTAILDKKIKKFSRKESKAIRNSMLKPHKFTALERGELKFDSSDASFIELENQSNIEFLYNMYTKDERDDKKMFRSEDSNHMIEDLDLSTSEDINIEIIDITQLDDVEIEESEDIIVID